MSVPSSEPTVGLDPAARPLPALRLLPVPVCEPPYDDELDGPALSVVPDVARAPLGPLRSLAPLRLVPALPDDDEDDGHRRTPVSDLPPARPVARALVQGLLEVLSGVRPVSQLQRGTTPELYAELEKVVHGAPRPTGSRPATGAVRSLHVQERPEGVAEVCATVQRGARAAAVALRLEGIGGRWCCTEVAGI
jgi:hypothetical protein